MSPQVLCEACASAADRLNVSDISPLVNYFRCQRCAAVWTEPKPGHSGHRCMITVPAKPESEPA